MKLGKLVGRGAADWALLWVCLPLHHGYVRQARPPVPSLLGICLLLGSHLFCLGSAALLLAVWFACFSGAALLFTIGFARLGGFGATRLFAVGRTGLAGVDHLEAFFHLPAGNKWMAVLVSTHPGPKMDDDPLLVEIDLFRYEIFIKNNRSDMGDLIFNFRRDTL